ncbi:MAG TPA: NUDIX domain-containing protein [Streptosporangiaceae bacterium]
MASAARAAGRGVPHGAEGVCVTPGGDIVIISPDGVIWDLPAGRPEPGETWEQTLRREMDEEACATVTGARLLGFTRGQCRTGPESGRVLVRSVWRAEVELRPWEARFEIADRRVVAPAAVADALSRMRCRSARTPSPRSSGASWPKPR